MCILLLPLIGSPNCPTVNTAVNTTSMAVLIHRSLSIRWLPARVWFNVEVSSHDCGLKAMVYKSTLKDTASFEATPLEPDTVYIQHHCHPMQHGGMQ